MKSISTNCNKHFDSGVFLDAEKKFSISIRNEIKDFIKMNAGGYPVKDIIVIDGEEYEIRVFLSADRKDPYFCIEKPMNFFLQKTHGKIIPIGIDSGDDYYCVNNETGKVYYWAHGEDLYYNLTATLSDFIECFGKRSSITYPKDIKNISDGKE